MIALPVQLGLLTNKHRVTSVVMIAFLSQACVQKQGAEATSMQKTVDAGPDLRANSAVALSGTATGSGPMSPTWSSTSDHVKIADPSNLKSTVIADADGVYVLTLSVKNERGADSSDQMSFEWDTTPPGAPQLNKEPGSNFLKDEGLSLTIISSKPADLKSYQYAINEEPLTNCSEGTETEGKIFVRSSSDIILKVAACDDLGNMSTIASSSFFCTDCTAGVDEDPKVDDPQDDPVAENQDGQPQTHQVHVNSPSSIAVTPSDSQTVGHGSTLTYSLEAAANFEVPVGTTPGGTCPTGSWNGNQYTSGNILSDCNIVFGNGVAIPDYSVTAVGIIDYPANYPISAKIWNASQLIANPSQIVQRGGVASFTVNLPTQWHRIVPAVSGCPAGTWSGSTYTTGVITGNCTVNLHIDTGTVISFSEIKAILGTKPRNTTSYVAGAVADVTAASSACISCHSKATENIGTTSAAAPSGQFSMTVAAATDVSACDVTFAPYADANDCRAAKIDYSKLTENARWDTKIKASYTSGSDIVTVTDATRLAVGNRINNTAAFPTSSNVTIQNIGPNAGIGLSANQIKLSGSALSTGSAAINIVLSTTSTSTKILQRDELFFCSPTECFSEKYKRVDPGSPKTSLLCIKPQPLDNVPSAVGLLTRMMDTGWLDAIKPTGFVFANLSGYQPRNRVMPYVGSWYIGDSNVDKICRWILQGAQNN